MSRSLANKGFQAFTGPQPRSCSVPGAVVPAEAFRSGTAQRAGRQPDRVRPLQHRRRQPQPGPSRCHPAEATCAVGRNPASRQRSTVGPARPSRSATPSTPISPPGPWRGGGSGPNGAVAARTRWSAAQLARAITGTDRRWRRRAATHSSTKAGSSTGPRGKGPNALVTFVTSCRLTPASAVRAATVDPERRRATHSAFRTRRCDAPEHSRPRAGNGSAVEVAPADRRSPHTLGRGDRSHPLPSSAPGCPLTPRVDPWHALKARPPAATRSRRCRRAAPGQGRHVCTGGSAQFEPRTPGAAEPASRGPNRRRSRDTGGPRQAREGRLPTPRRAQAATGGALGKPIEAVPPSAVAVSHVKQHDMTDHMSTTHQAWRPPPRRR